MDLVRIISLKKERERERDPVTFLLHLKTEI